MTDLLPSTSTDLNAARLFFGVSRMSEVPGFYRTFSQAEKVAKWKSEWGRPIDEYIHDMFCYEYGFLCFQVMILLTTQIAVLKRASNSAIDEFVTWANRYHPRDVSRSELLATHTMNQLVIYSEEHPNAPDKDPATPKLTEMTHTPQGRTVILPVVGGMTDLDAVFIIRELWKSRKQLSYIVSKVPMPGWIFLLRFSVEHLFENHRSARYECAWGSLENVIHRYALSMKDNIERMFSAERRFKPEEFEAFVPPLVQDIDVVGFLGRVTLLPMDLLPDPRIDACWATVIEYIISLTQLLTSKISTLSAKVFTDEYPTWLKTLSYIRLQVLNNQNKNESLRENAQGAELAWMNVGKMFGFSDQAPPHNGQREPTGTRTGVYGGGIL
ncbi:hypothetical protein FRC07_006879 [Ceratobasidium sp. 392]|nr:hypothetical protein FRC07_006879 [Ceratobasidium sp. 392]